MTSTGWSACGVVSLAAEVGLGDGCVVFAEGKCKRCLDWGVFEGVTWPETGFDEGVGAIKENPRRKCDFSWMFLMGAKIDR